MALIKVGVLVCGPSAVECAEAGGWLFCRRCDRGGGSLENGFCNVQFLFFQLGEVPHLHLPEFQQLRLLLLL